MRLSAWQKSRLDEQVRGSLDPHEPPDAEEHQEVPTRPTVAGGFHLLEPKLPNEEHPYQYLHAFDPRATHHARQMGGRHR